MQKFTVTVRRVSCGFHDIEVEAETEEQAEDMALKTAKNYYFSEKQSAYMVDQVWEHFP